MACAKAVDGFELRTGPDKGKKVIVDGPEYETAASLGSNVGIFDPCGPSKPTTTPTTTPTTPSRWPPA